MPGTAAKILEPITCPFTVVVDTREQSAYEFTGLSQGSGPTRRQLIIPTRRETISVGDYSIFGMPGVVVERKSKADLFGSVVKRENFISRLERMSELAHSAVVVEAELSEILSRPPSFTKYPPRSLVRTIMAWSMRYPAVHWWFCPGRQAAEGMTFRLLERFYTDRMKELR